MKTKSLKISAFSLIFAVIFSFLSVNVFAETAFMQYIYDPVHLLDDVQYYELNTLAAETSEKYSCAVHFIVTDDPAVNLDNIQKYAEDLYLESAALGYGQNKDGVMLLLSTYDRCYWLLAYGEKGNYAFTDYAKDWMSGHFVDEFADNDWYNGFKDYITDCDYILSEAANGTPVDIYYDNDTGIEAYGIALVFGLIVAFIICALFKSNMKTAVIATRAEDYVDKNNIDITGRHHQFLFSTVSRTKIQSESSGSSCSRGGTSVSSRGFSGKGGRF